MSEILRCCEIFKSIQGESTFAGCICSFVRLAGCNLACTYCDTRYAHNDHTELSADAVVAMVQQHATHLVELTGGEPLLQQAAAVLARQLLALGKTVLVETNGSIDIGILPTGCIRIVDVKCPSSGMCGSFDEHNLSQLTSSDEIKFVIGSHDDFAWALEFINRHQLQNRTKMLFSPVTGVLQAVQLAQWILDASAPVRLQLQLHKLLWGNKRGV